MNVNITITFFGSVENKNILLQNLKNGSDDSVSEKNQPVIKILSTGKVIENIKPDIIKQFIKYYSPTNIIEEECSIHSSLSIDQLLGEEFSFDNIIDIAEAYTLSAEIYWENYELKMFGSTYFDIVGFRKNNYISDNLFTFKLTSTDFSKIKVKEGGMKFIYKNKEYDFDMDLSESLEKILKLKFNDKLLTARRLVKITDQNRYD